MINLKTPSNYTATIVKLTNIRQHSNADRLQCTSVYANNIITGMNAKVGDIVVYFPLECQISNEFLAYTNSYSTSSRNADTTVKGYFDAKGRVRAINLRKEPSQGYIVPISSIEDFCKNVLKKKFVFDENMLGKEFDSLFDHVLCKKYIPIVKHSNGNSTKSKGNIKKYESRLVENQFTFHPDTGHLKKSMGFINPDDFILIQNKIHGANFIVGHVLVKKTLTKFQKLKKALRFNVNPTEYGMIYSSRSVIKNIHFEDKEHNHFYKEDVWKIVADRLFPLLKAGYTAYGELFGYTQSGGMIQKGYDYGLPVGQLGYVVFRMTYTSPNGHVIELSHPQVTEYCKLHGIPTPETYYYGRAGDFDKTIEIGQHWHENMLQLFISKYLEKKCHLCKNDVPAEGVVVRVDKPFKWEVYKLKSFSFLKRETEMLDAGEVDMETNETLTDENEESDEQKTV